MQLKAVKVVWVGKIFPVQLRRMETGRYTVGCDTSHLALHSVSLQLQFLQKPINWVHKMVIADQKFVHFLQIGVWDLHRDPLFIFFLGFQSF